MMTIKMAVRETIVALAYDDDIMVEMMSMLLDSDELCW